MADLRTCGHYALCARGGQWQHRDAHVSWQQYKQHSSCCLLIAWMSAGFSMFLVALHLLLLLQPEGHGNSSNDPVTVLQIDAAI